MSALRPFVLLLSLVAVACRSGRDERAQRVPPPLTAAEIAAEIPARIADRASWGQAIHDALVAHGLPLDRPTVCAVIAITGQESGFRADPAVPGMSRLLKARIEKARGKLGPLGKPLFSRLLSGRAPGQTRTFEQRIETVRTERDVDRLFRDILAFYENGYPKTFEAVSLAGKLFDVDSLSELNPITTAGPMQVSVTFAQEWAREHNGDPETVREALYTPQGGVYYGVARLFGHKTAYDQPLYRFADYNAGVYASRNAAVQQQLAKLTGKSLTPDGDLLAYEKDGEPRDEDSQTMLALLAFRARYAPDLSERQVRKEARKEKSQEFEGTDTYKAITRVYAAKFGPPSYAVLPQVEIESPKLSGKRSTAWFARSVQRRFDGCLAP